MLQIPELLAPAGDLERLRYAINYGADAVYCALPEFGMRSAPTNFTPEQLSEGVIYAHARGRKVYLTMNTLPTNEEADRLPEAIKEAAKAGIVQDILLEVNIGGEESKTGAAPELLWPLLDTAAAQEHIRVKGLMAIPPVNDDDAQNRRYLAQVYQLFVRAGERGYHNVEMQTLSMGMSGDFENAIREGATLVRIGTAIYGERDYSKK